MGRGAGGFGFFVEMDEWKGISMVRRNGEIRYFKLIGDICEVK